MLRGLQRRQKYPLLNYYNVPWLTRNWLWIELLQGGKSYIFMLCFYQNMEKNYSYMKYLLCLVLFFPVLFSCNTGSTSPEVDTGDTAANRWVKPAGKDSLLLLTDRPPNLETPLKYFRLDYTPNNVFFVRWHLAGLPDSVNLDTFRLRIGGNVNKELALSVNDLITKFQPVTITAVCQCTGRTMEEWGD